MSTKKPLPKGKKVVCDCHGYPANRKTAHIGVIWEDVYLEFKGHHRKDRRKHAPMFAGMADLRQQVVDETRWLAKYTADALDPNYPADGAGPNRETFKRRALQTQEDLAKYAEYLRRCEAGETVVESTRPGEEHIPNIYMPYELLNRANLEEGIAFYMRGLGFDSPPRFKWLPTSIIVWSC